VHVNLQCEGAEVAVPGSIANLGPGFDTLAVAVQLYLRVRVLHINQRRKKVLQFKFVDQQLQGDNAIEHAFRCIAYRHGFEFPTLSLEVRSDIPMRAGLGSSAAATVAGLRIFELLTGPCTAQELLSLASELEGHPDNAAAALLGGLASSCQAADGSVVAVSSPWPQAVGFVVLTPEIPLRTLDSRNVLPSEIDRADAVFNLQRVSLLLNSLRSGDFTLIKEAMRDRWHQPFRQRLVPGLEQMLALSHPDLLGVCLSGSGPSIVALAQKNLGDIGDLMSESYMPLGIPHQVRILRAHQPSSSAGAGNNNPSQLSEQQLEPELDLPRSRRGGGNHTRSRRGSRRR
jgi:homoserine kinase